MASQSWLQSFLSPTKKWVATEHLKVLSKRLRDYGFTLRSVLTRMEAKDDEATTDDSRTESLLSLGEVEKIIGYNFKNQELLQQAFTHPSYHERCLSYERLEYVGDSVLNLLITKQQFFMYPSLPPGLMSPLRAANVDTEKLARVAVKHNLHKYIRYGYPILTRQIREFVWALQEYPLHSNGLIDAPKVLADVVESTIGAIFIDTNSSIDTTWEIVRGLLEPIITPELHQTHPVQKLYETCQKHGFKIRILDLWSKEGAYEVLVNNQFRGRGTYRAKKEIALNRAAHNAYYEIVRKLGVKHDNDDGPCGGRAEIRVIGWARVFPSNNAYFMDENASLLQYITTRPSSPSFIQYLQRQKTKPKKLRRY